MQINEWYDSKLKQFGKDDFRSLNWGDKEGKSAKARFQQMFDQYNWLDKKVLEVGCGWGSFFDFGFDKTNLSKQETSFVSNTALSLIEKISIDNPNTDAASIVLDEIRTVALPSKGENSETQYVDLDENQKFAVDLL